MFSCKIAHEWKPREYIWIYGIVKTAFEYADFLFEPIWTQCVYIYDETFHCIFCLYKVLVPIWVVLFLSILLNHHWGAWTEFSGRGCIELF